MTPKLTRKRFANVVKMEGATVVAVRIRCSVSQIQSIADGRRNPGLRTAVAIKEAYGIPEEDWVARPAARSVL